MTAEFEQPTKVESPLPSGHRLLFPSPGFLYGGAFKAGQLVDEDPRGFSSIIPRNVLTEQVKKSLDELGQEYLHLLAALATHVGRENLTIVKNKFTMGKTDPETEQTVFKSIDYPDFEEFDNIHLQAFIDHPTVWTRDGFTNIGPLTLIHSVYFQDIPNFDGTVKSLFAEGGSVLHAKDAVLVSEGLWSVRDQDKGFQKLKDLGFKIAPLPLVDPEKQTLAPHHTHIDTHADLIVDKDDNLQLLVAESYSRQGHGTRKRIRFAAETIGAETFEVDDRNLPPFALNFIQFADKSVVVTNSQNSDLILTLQLMLGEEKVITPHVPLVKIPSVLGGSIRCMVNTIPESVLNGLES